MGGGDVTGILFCLHRCLCTGATVSFLSGGNGSFCFAGYCCLHGPGNREPAVAFINAEAREDREVIIPEEITLGF